MLPSQILFFLLCIARYKPTKSPLSTRLSHKKLICLFAGYLRDENSRFETRFELTYQLGGMKILSNIKKFDWSHCAKKPHFITVRYLEEARTCLGSGAFRMSVVASACALNFGLDYVLRLRRLMQEEKVQGLDKVIKRIRKYVSENPSTVLSEIPLDKCDKIRHCRNAFAHPEDFLILKQSNRPNLYTLKPKFGTRKDKEEAYIASQYNKTELKEMAEESLNIAYNVIRESLEKITLP